MIEKVINGEEFKKAIKAAFDGDTAIFELYCPHIKVTSVDQIVSDIFCRIRKDEADVTLKGIYEKGELIGYYVYRKDMLVSFAINIRFRTRSYLKELFKLMRRSVGKKFVCFLWTKNIRAIKYLIKNGMTVIGQDHLITQLKLI